jgi:hypothetical protein
LRSEHRRSLLATIELFALAALVSSCEIGKIELPVAEATLVVHGILSPTTTTQTVLLERTLTGVVSVPLVYPFDGSEPIVSDYGIAEAGATAEIVTPAGAVITGRELSAISVNGHGGGVYQFPLAGSSLVPGGRYRLRMTTTKHETLTAETVVPIATLVTTGATVSFNRATDTLSVTWNRVTNARGYQVRIESPYGPWIAYTDSTHIALTGTLRNLLADRLPNLFVPGFRQLLTVSAVDSNTYEYYRSSNEAFTGVGIVSRVSGATGVFGSQVTIARRTVDVTAPILRPIEGIFDVQLGSLGYLYGGLGDAVSMTLYVESPSVRSDQPDAITGSYRHSFGTSQSAASGTFSNGRLKLVFLGDQTLTDSVDHFTGDLKGDTIIGEFSKGAKARYLRRK